MEKRSFDIITFNETWLQEGTEDSMLDVGDFDIYRLDRSGRKGGGLMTLVNRDDTYVVNVEKHKNKWVSNVDCEMQIIEIKPGNIRKTLVLNCYRPPTGNVTCFVNCIHDTLDAIVHLEEYDIYVCGDFNIPYNETGSTGVKKLKSIESKYGLKQYITSPTRCTSQSKNILDLIFTNAKHIRKAVADEVSISDHEPVYIVKKKMTTKLPRSSFTCRSFVEYERDLFQQDLLNYDWSTYFRTQVVDDLWAELKDVITRVADLHCPVRVHSNRKKLMPWVNDELLEMIHERDSLYKQAKRKDTSEDWALARRSRNRCNKMVKKAKYEFVKNQLTINEKDPRKFWNIIQDVWTPNPTKSGHIHLTDQMTGHKIDDEHVPEIFNKHLSEVGPSLAANFANAPPFVSTIHNVLSRFTYVNITDEEVVDLIVKIQLHKSSAIEGLSARVIKDSFGVLFKQLVFI